MFKMKKRKLEGKGRVFQEKWEDMHILAKSVIKLLASFTLMWDQLQNNVISSAITKFHIKTNVAFLKGS
jgi:hypothetical protein